MNFAATIIEHSVRFMRSIKRRRRPGSAKAYLAVRIAAVVVLALVLIPYVLTPLYLVVRPVSTLMLWRWATGARVVRTWTPVERISPELPLAVIVAEDVRFCSHVGVDFHELREAIEEADDLAEARGGSTLTQQIAKNLFLWPGRSFVRKGLEFPLALWINLVMSKRRQMEIYLNIAEWGPNGVFGAEAASRYAFSKSAQELNLREAATLAATLPNPVQRNARQPSPLLGRLAGIYEMRSIASPQVDACVRRVAGPVARQWAKPPVRLSFRNTFLYKPISS
jgi:monofunctional glycosyltransferase